MVLQIHDELIFEIPEGQVVSLTRIIKEEMENAIPLSVPLKVTIAVGTRWGELY